MIGTKNTMIDMKNSLNKLISSLDTAEDIIHELKAKK